MTSEEETTSNDWRSNLPYHSLSTATWESFPIRLVHFREDRKEHLVVDLGLPCHDHRINVTCPVCGSHWNGS